MLADALGLGHLLQGHRPRRPKADLHQGAEAVLGLRGHPHAPSIPQKRLFPPGKRGFKEGEAEEEGLGQDHAGPAGPVQEEGGVKPEEGGREGEEEGKEGHAGEGAAEKPGRRPRDHQKGGHEEDPHHLHRHHQCQQSRNRLPLHLQLYMEDYNLQFWRNHRIYYV